MPSAVHEPSTAGPVHDSIEFGQECICTVEKSRRVIDPAAWIEHGSVDTPVFGDLGVLDPEQCQR